MWKRRGENETQGVLFKSRSMVKVCCVVILLGGELEAQSDVVEMFHFLRRIQKERSGRERAVIRRATRQSEVFFYRLKVQVSHIVLDQRRQVEREDVRKFLGFNTEDGVNVEIEANRASRKNVALDTDREALKIDSSHHGLFGLYAVRGRGNGYDRDDRRGQGIHLVVGTRGETILGKQLFHISAPQAKMRGDDEKKQEE